MGKKKILTTTKKDINPKRKMLRLVFLTGVFLMVHFQRYSIETFWQTVHAAFFLHVCSVASASGHSLLSHLAVSGPSHLPFLYDFSPVK